MYLIFNSAVLATLCTLIWLYPVFGFSPAPVFVRQFQFSNRFHQLQCSSSSTSASSSGTLNQLNQLQILFDCDEVSSEDISEFLFEIGSNSVSVEVESEKTEVLNYESRWAEFGHTRSWKTAFLRANFDASTNITNVLDMLKENFPLANINASIEGIPADKDWVLEVQKSWPPLQILEDLTILFPWHKDEIVYTKHQLLIEGGAAFGTGDHPTTRLCSRWLSKVLKSGKEHSLSVLDYGCGSGILGLIALKYGAKYSVGVDIDSDSLKSAAENCAANNLKIDLFLTTDDDSKSKDDSFYEIFSSVSEIQNNKYDIVVANILAPILIALVSDLAHFTSHGGKIALSGLVTIQKDSVIQAFEQYFDEVQVSDEENGWAMITGIRK
jgi:ribosomal protein L11 methyltransferase